MSEIWPSRGSDFERAHVIGILKQTCLRVFDSAMSSQNLAQFGPRTHPWKLELTKLHPLKLDGDNVLNHR